MKTLLFLIDLYPILPKFYISKNKSIPSMIGGILTIFFISISIIFLFFTFTDFFKKQNFNNLYSRDTMQYFQFNHSRIPLIISFYDRNANQIPIDILEKYINIELDYYEIDLSKSQIIEKTSFRPENCNLTTVLKNHSISINASFRYDLLCLPTSQKDFEILGSYGDLRGFSMINFVFSKCLNNTKNNNTCYDINSINDFIDNSTLIIASIDYDIDHRNVINPFIPKFISEGFSMNPYLFKTIYLKRKKVLYTSDSGYFTKNETHFENYLHDFSDFKSQIFTKNDTIGNFFMELSIETSGIQETFYRRYQRLHEALAGVFVIINGLNFLFQTFMELVHQKIYFQKIINKVMNFDETLNILDFNRISELKNSLFERNTHHFNHNPYKKDSIKREFKKIYMYYFFFKLSYKYFRKNLKKIQLILLKYLCLEEIKIR